MKIFLILITIMIITLIAGYLMHPRPVQITGENEKYIGHWVDQVGNFIKIDQGGVGSYRFQNSNMSGASVRFGKDEIIFHFGPISKKFKISKVPEFSEKGMLATIENKIFLKQTLNQTGDVRMKKIDGKHGSFLNKQIISTLNNSIKKKDVKIFYNVFSKTFKDEYSLDAFLESFKPYYEREMSFDFCLERFPIESIVSYNHSAQLTKIESTVEIEEGVYVLIQIVYERIDNDFFPSLFNVERK